VRKKNLQIWDIDKTVTTFFGTRIYPKAKERFNKIDWKNSDLWFITGRSDLMTDVTTRLIKRLTTEKFKIYFYKFGAFSFKKYLQFKRSYFRRALRNYDRIDVYDDRLDVLFNLMSVEHSKKVNIYLSINKKYIKIRNIEHLLTFVNTKLKRNTKK